MAANYYDVLNITKDADSKAISDAYKKMALKWHPDKNPDNVDEANQRFKQISQAYQILSDSTKRLRYDQSQDMDFCDSDDDDEFGPFSHFVSPEMLFRHFFRQNEATSFPFFFTPFFCAHDFDDDRNNERRRRRNSEAEEDLRHEKRRESVGKESCHIRTVNGKQWMTKTHYENGHKIVTRYEDGEMISKQINGVAQKI